MPENNNIQKVVIVGGGTSGWMTAAALSKLFKNRLCEIELIESAEIPNVGVGEATIPQIQLFNQLLGIDENEFIRKTQATFKHGIEFVNWQKINHSYMHPFGTIGLNFEGVEFHHFWIKMAQLGKVGSIQDYAFNSVAGKAGKMMRSVNVPNSPLASISYAYHFDAGLYVKLLREVAEKNNTTRIESTVKQVNLNPENGFISSLSLANGQEVTGDLFIDCTGFRGLLIEGALHTGYQDWSHWLPCDSAVVAPSKLVNDPEPYTRSTAQPAGWQWRIPLQHRMGNGYVFSSKFTTDDEAKKILVDGIEGELLAEPRFLRFKGGMRNKYWNKNCVAIGLSSGFIEPLESTAIHLVQSSISRLMSLFPTKDFVQNDIDTYNQQAQVEMERIRDFIICHYKLTERDDTPFWRFCQHMDIPESLHKKIALFKSTGRVFREDEELFNQSSWVSVMLGQGLMPERYHPMVDVLPIDEIEKRMQNIQHVIKTSVEKMPTQAEFIASNC
ncbi:tryptophan halogenase family protein [Algibacillus agarilyticus]|uniref:tryptophan halogenase family protein n=1 Tax=Algibacillus agarilyticus TaxID=2234133 RepID=UPI000DCFFC71|nr:tryptophan halogenase family protein [Algibacillus agarilyticus]